MGTWTLVFDILKTGFFLAVGFGVIYAIIWAMVRNIKWFFGMLRGRSDEGVVRWLVEGLKKGYDDRDLKIILLDKGCKPKHITKALKEAYHIIIKEEEGEDAEKGRRLRSPEEEIEKLAGKK